jgi:hypothetical protein
LCGEASGQKYDNAAYRYYISRSASRYGASCQKKIRLPADEIEAAVVGQIRSVLASPEAITAVVREVQHQGMPLDEATVVLAMGNLNGVWDQLFPVERHRIAALMVERVDLVDGDTGQGMLIRWRELGWRALIGEFAGGTIGAELVEAD